MSTALASPSPTVASYASRAHVPEKWAPVFREGHAPTQVAARPPIDVRARAREQAIEFEAVFLNNMFNQMFTGIDGDGPFGGGDKAGVWRSFLTDEYSKSFARAGGIGIADHVYRALLNQQEAQPVTANTTTPNTRTP